ncbi:glycoside hydrolase [Ascobolus immersus RN42]|uniref:Alpha-amylase n=1 Tax=Ascobolus immersus RN42 TaxID=1160509 RepID=A0A3N4IJ39_ASCIM|nr:glycoside hydrolase [Ascobolus immersus RN42]
MWFRQLFIVVATAAAALSTPLSLQKRATQVSLINHDYYSNVLSGTINVQNIAYSKTVNVIYAVGNSWLDSQKIAAKYKSASSNGYEIWEFSGSAPGATQFYIKYDVSGTSYYDPGNNVNHKVVEGGSSSSSTSTIVSTTSSNPSITTTSTIPTTSTGPGGPVGAPALPGILPEAIPSEPIPAVPSGCNTWNGLDSCTGTSSEFVASSEKRRWQTPPKTANDPQYIPQFQDYRDLIGYANIQYSSGRNSAIVTINAASRTGESLTYHFNDVAQASQHLQVSGSYTGTLSVKVTTASGKQLVLEPLNFVWDKASLSAAQSSFSNGQKGAIVEMFGWPFNDVAKECSFIGKAGYMGVKLFPVQEAVWGSHYYETDNQFRPWYHIYQPVSYRLKSRMGTREELRNMIQACRTAGVRVYADAVVNHMVGQGTDIANHRSNCNYYSGHNATDGSPYFTSGNTYLLNPYTGTRPTLEFPAVPYGPTDFHCERSLNSWTDGNVITKGWLVGLTDLNTEKEYVQDRIATYLVDLISIGFSGFRVDAAKHIGPRSMAQILGRVKNKLGGSFPEDFITWMEVILGGESNLLGCSGGEWSWYTNFDKELLAAGISNSDIQKVKIWSSDYPKEHPACGRWIIPASRFVIQNDDHDQQNPGSSSRDMQDKGSVLIKDKNIAAHRSFEKQLFTRTDADWHIKMILSSYMYAANGGNGFPDGLSDCSLYTGSINKAGCLGVPKDVAFQEKACAYNLTPGQYTRVHRDVEIINAMRSWVGLGSTSASALGISGC